MLLSKSSTRLNVVVAMSFALFLATYFLWTGSHETFIPSFRGLGNTQETLDQSTPGTIQDEINNQTKPQDNAVVPEIPKNKTQEEIPPKFIQDDHSNSIEEDLASVFLAEYDETPIKELCASTSWVSSKDIVIHCHERVGGVGNVRQEFLVCVRDAIEIGAGLIRPTIMLRSEGLIEYQNGPTHNMSYMFDLELFDKRLKSACPEMPLYDDLEDVAKLGEVVRVYRNRNLPQGDDGKTISPKTWANQNRAEIGKILVIDMDRMMKMEPVCVDPTPFVAQFGGLIDFRPDIQQLTTRALNKLANRFHLPPPTQYGIMPDAFVGLHLRSEVDAINVGYTTYEVQEAAYISYIESSPLRAVYAASGNTTSLELISAKAAALNAPAEVVTKWDLLSKNDVKFLKSLTWDQQALVDYLILARSTMFLGVSDSSFSWGLVYTRQMYSNTGLCNETDSTPEGMEYLDDLSAIWGTPRDWHQYKLWP